MRLSNRLRPLIIGLAAATIALLAPGTAHADPPSNDDFDNATPVAALPFKAALDVSTSTKAADDPTSCNSWISWSVWYSYTAPADGIVRALPSSTGTQPFVAVYTGDRGSLNQIPGACTDFGTVPSATFHVTAGTTYHIMLFQQYAISQASLELRSMPPSPNDDFAGATVAELPGEYTDDLTQASGEPGEAGPSCDTTASQSVWYRYTPDRTRSVSVEPRSFSSPAITVYRGTAPASLSEVDCVRSGEGKTSVFTAVAGQTYQIRVANGAENAGWFDVRIMTAPALTPSVGPWPTNPSVFDDVAFTPYSGDRLGRPFVSGEIRFGDGTSAPIAGETPLHHKYAADGTYQVEVSGATNDGRTGTGVVPLKVETHDVSLSDFAVPAQARAGQTKSIKVNVSNGRYDEKVSVELLKASGNGYFEHVGTLTQSVAANLGRKVEFPFAYTYTAADAAAGQVTFKVVATLNNGYPPDAHPQDNELVATTTSVRATSSRMI